MHEFTIILMLILWISSACIYYHFNANLVHIKCVYLLLFNANFSTYQVHVRCTRSALCVTLSSSFFTIVKPVLNGQSKVDKTKILMTNGSLVKVDRIAESSPWAILQYP